MTHGDDDGLIVPPRLAPTHVVILPIVRSVHDEQTVGEYCHSLKEELQAQHYAGEPVRVEIDARDIRGGEKTWQHVKRGVPVRLEVGPRDVASDSVFAARRDKPPKEKQGVPRKEFVAEIGKLLTEIQEGLFQRAVAYRDENTRTIDDRDELDEYFTPRNEDQPEIHGGFALCHVSESEEADAALKEKKLTVRCIPQDGPDEEGPCIITGQPSHRRAVIAKAY